MKNSLSQSTLVSVQSSKNWIEYGLEALALGIFMISACFVVVFFEHPSSVAYQWVPHSFVRRTVIGILMGLTAIMNIYSPWGKRSGAHMNPSVTLTFYRLGKVKLLDAFFYILFQFLGALAGVGISFSILKDLLSHPSVHYASTRPGLSGSGVAFVSEVVISFGMMLMILVISNHKNLSRWTGIFAGIFVAIYISFEAPLSGMSMNPARTLGSNVFAADWEGLWIYFIAPLVGMFLAAEFYMRVLKNRRVYCAKLSHSGAFRCIFRCEYEKLKHS